MNIKIRNFISFPQVNNPDTFGINESLFKNPAISAIGPDKKLYIGFLGEIFTPSTTETHKGIGRIDKRGNFEIIVEFPKNGGVVEKLLFGDDDILYVVVARYDDPQGELINGIVKINIKNNTFEQFWGDSSLQFPTGLAIDERRNFYVADSNLGQIYKVDRFGNGVLWLDNALLKDPDVNSQFPVGVNGLVYDDKENILYAGNYNAGTVLRIRVNRNGTAGPITKILDSDNLISIDNLTISPNKKYIFAAIFNSGQIIRINIRKRIPTYKLVASNLGNPVHALPIKNFDNKHYNGGLFVSNLGSTVFPQGNISLVENEGNSGSDSDSDSDFW